MSKKAAYGTRLRYIDPDSELMERIHYVADISGPELSVETIDASTHDSPDHFNEFLPGAADGGDVSFDLMFDPDSDGHARILELISQREMIPFNLVAPKPNVEFISDTTLASGWSVTGDWSFEDDIAKYDSLEPTGTDSLGSEVTGLIPGEPYKLRVTVSSVGSGPPPLIYFAGEYIADLDIESAGVKEYTFIPTQDSGDLSFAHQAAEQEASARIDAVSLMGVGDLETERFDFTGMFTKAGILMPVKDALKATVAIKVSGKPELTI